MKTITTMTTGDLTDPSIRTHNGMAQELLPHTNQPSYYPSPSFNVVSLDLSQVDASDQRSYRRPIPVRTDRTVHGKLIRTSNLGLSTPFISRLHPINVSIVRTFNDYIVSPNHKLSRYEQTINNIELCHFNSFKIKGVFSN